MSKVTGVEKLINKLEAEIDRLRSRDGHATIEVVEKLQAEVAGLKKVTANDHRTTVCVNACRAISTAALEAGVVEKMLIVFRSQLQLKQPNLTTDERTKIFTDSHKIITEILDLLKDEGKNMSNKNYRRGTKESEAGK